MYHAWVIKMFKTTIEVWTDDLNEKLVERKGHADNQAFPYGWASWDEINDRQDMQSLY